MNKKGPRATIFVCVAIDDNQNLITKIINSSSEKEAIDLFTVKFNMSPQEVLGPFFKKRAKIIEEKTSLKFSNQTKKAIYNDWFVNAFLLIEPIDHAFLVFIKRTDNKKVPSPKGTITVPISELKFI